MGLLALTMQPGNIQVQYVGHKVIKTRLINDIIKYTSDEHLGGPVLFFDLRKAFDTIGWQFMSRTLRKVWTQVSYIVNEVRYMYNKVISCGWLLENFAVPRGTHQGCPLSTLPFATIVIEIMATKIRNSEKMTGIKIMGRDWGDPWTQFTMAPFSY